MEEGARGPFICEYCFLFLSIFRVCIPDLFVQVWGKNDEILGFHFAITLCCNFNE